MRIALAILVAALGTTKVVFTPFHGSLLGKDVKIARTASGRCTYGSEVLARFDAWSCVAGGKRLDPCFSNDQNPHSPVVACLSAPWRKAVIVELTKKLPQSLANVVGDPRRHAPWALVLTDGARCVRGKTAAWRCDDGVVLRGEVVRTQRTWRIGDSAIAAAYW